MDLKRPLGLAFALSTASACTWFNEDPFESDRLREEVSTPEAIDLKLDRFERCRASLNPVIEESYARYKKVAGKKGKSSARDRYFGIERAKFRTCAVAIADGLALEPSMPELESAAKAVRTVASEYAERSRWHGRHDGDGVIEADPRMERSYERWKDADVFFVAILDRTRQVNDPKLLEVLEKDGGLPLLTRSIVVHARPLVRCLVQEPSPKKKECEPLFADFLVEYERFSAYVESRDTEDTFWIDTFTHDAKGFREVSEGALERLSEGKLPRRERAQLERTWDDLLRDADTLRFEFP